MQRSKIILLISSLIVAMPAFSQEFRLSDAEKMIPREFTKPVKSLIPNSELGIDTLDTENPMVKIVLCDDGTWHYWKEPDLAAAQDVFSDHWDHVNTDSYKLSWEDFPYKSYIWLVDSASRYRYPGDLDNISVSSRFGRRGSRYHRGIDIRLPKGTPLYAAFDGKVRISKYVSGYGNVVVLRHENGLETFYGHMSKLEVEQDEWVHAGQEIGLAGATGRASGSHLHWEVRYLGYAIDPEWIVNFETGELRHSVLTFKKQYLDPNYRFAPESDDEEEEIALQDEADRLEAERLEAEMKAAKYVTVKKGDTLSRIAANNATSVSALCKLNGISQKSILKIGQKIRVK